MLPASVSRALGVDFHIEKSKKLCTNAPPSVSDRKGSSSGDFQGSFTDGDIPTLAVEGLVVRTNWYSTKMFFFDVRVNVEGGQAARTEQAQEETSAEEDIANERIVVIQTEHDDYFAESCGQAASREQADEEKGDPEQAPSDTHDVKEDMFDKTARENEKKRQGVGVMPKSKGGEPVHEKDAVGGEMRNESVIEEAKDTRPKDNASQEAEDRSVEGERQAARVGILSFRYFLGERHSHGSGEDGRLRAVDIVRLSGAFDVGDEILVK